MVEPFVSFRVSRAQRQACLSMIEVEKVRRKSSLRLSRARRVHEHLETLCAQDKAARRRPVGKKAGCDRAFRFWEFVSLRFLFWFIILCRVFRICTRHLRDVIPFSSVSCGKTALPPIGTRRKNLLPGDGSKNPPVGKRLIFP